MTAPNCPEPVTNAEQFTPDPADVELVAKVFITEARKNPVSPSPYSWGVTSRLLLGPNEHDIARAILTALAAAGQLCPPGAREKWSVACQSCSSDGWTPGPGCSACGVPVPTTPTAGPDLAPNVADSARSRSSDGGPASVPTTPDTD